VSWLFSFNLTGIICAGLLTQPGGFVKPRRRWVQCLSAGFDGTQAAS